MEPTTRPPAGLRGAWALIRRTVQGALDDRLPGLAAEISFYSIFAIPPLLLAIAGSVGYLGQLLGPVMVDRLEVRALQFASTFLTERAMTDVVSPMVNALLRDGRPDVTVLGLALSLWSASRVSRVLIEAVGIAYDRRVRRPIWKKWAMGLGVTLAGVVAVLVVLPIMVLGPQFGEALAARFGLADAFRIAWNVLYWPVVAIVGTLLLAAMYHLVVPVHSPFVRDLPGAVLALVIWLAGSAGVRAYALFSVETSTAFQVLAGPIVAAIVALMWIYITAVAVLVGAELNAAIEELWPADPRSRSRPAEDGAPPRP